MDLSHHATRYIGQPIVAHHVDGSVHRGILQSVTPQGMYLQYGAGHASKDQEEKMEAELVFFGLGFLPWLALAGFWGGGLWW